MRHYFVINPAAGRQDSREDISAIVKEKLGDEATIYVTTKPHDATDYVRRICENEPGKKRFWACGGDGTLNEVLNGMADFEGVQLAAWPCGSGNDYIKYYSSADEFLSLDKQLAGEIKTVDILCVNNRYAINEINFGFDSVAAKFMQKVKRMPVIGGRNAYITGVLYALINAVNNECYVSASDEKLNPGGRMLLCTAMCGQYIGGQFRCAPFSKVDDGLIDLCLVKPIPRYKLLSLLKKYEDGSYLTDKALSAYLSYRQVESLSFSAPEGWHITLDGESMDISSGTISIVPQKIDFVVPQ